MTDKSESLKQQLQDALYEIDKLREENAQLKQSATPPISSPVIKPKVKVHQSASTPDVKKEYDRLEPVKDLNTDDVITIRVLFKISKGKNFRVDGGVIDLIVEYIDEGKVLAAITSQLPKEFSLNTGDSQLYD